MTTPGIFLIRDDSELIELASTMYDSETLLQGLLERYPNLLAGDQVDADSPRRWLLVAREAAIPEELDGSGRWSLDHLFLDQDGIPTFVEVKRSTDTRIRREVVGQMLDYAANGVAFWPVEAIQAMFEARCERAGADARTVLSEFLGVPSASDGFWNQVKLNLQAGKVRLIFVADIIPKELRQIVEFLNNQMDPAEVLAIEVKQYIGGNFRGLVPRVIGQTEQGNRKKKAPGLRSPSVRWDTSSFLGELTKRFGPEDTSVAAKIIQWANDAGAECEPGLGASTGSLFYNFGHGAEKLRPFALWTYGKVEIEFQELMYTPRLAEEANRREFQRRLNSIPGVSISDDSLTKRPSIPFRLLRAESALTQFKDAVIWVAELTANTRGG